MSRLIQPTVTCDLAAGTAKIEQCDAAGNFTGVIELELENFEALQNAVGAAKHRLKTTAPLPPPHVHTFDELKAIFGSIADQVRSAHRHFALYKAIAQQTGPFNKEMNRAPHFWNMAMTANYLAALECLCRAYDVHPRGNNLQTLMEGLRDSATETWMPPKFPGDAAPERRPRPKEEQIAEDLLSVSEKELVAKKLIWVRNNLIAHVNREDVVNGGVLAAINRPNDSEIAELLERARKILNRYADAFKGTVFAMHTMGEDDFKYCLDALRVQREAEEEQERREDVEMGVLPAST